MLLMEQLMLFLIIITYNLSREGGRVACIEVLTGGAFLRRAISASTVKMWPQTDEFVSFLKTES